MRSVYLSIIHIIEERGKLLFVVGLKLVPILNRLWMPVYHVSTVGHHFMLPTYLRHVQVCHVVELLLRDRVLSNFFVFNDIRSHDTVLIVIVVLVTHTYLLMVVTVS